MRERKLGVAMNPQSKLTQDGTLASAPPCFDLMPLRRKGPPLWIRRIAIWDGKDKLEPKREILFNPGLNIVSTMLPGRSDTSGRSFNVGKTALCGLIRYCLGATRFGSDKLEGQIRRAFPNGAVSAEIVVKGEPWLIIRGFGAKRFSSVQQGSDLSALWLDYESEHRSGIKPLINAMKAALGLAAPRFEHVKPGTLPIQTAIGLLTRDHVVGFRDVLYWTNSRTREATFTRDKREKLLLSLLGVSTEPLPSFEAAGPISDTEASQASLQQLTRVMHRKLQLPKSVRETRVEASQEIAKRLERAKTERMNAIASRKAAQIEVGVLELERQLDEANKALLDERTVCPVINDKISSLINRGCLLKRAGCEPAVARARVTQIKAALTAARTKLEKAKTIEYNSPASANLPEDPSEDPLEYARRKRDRWDKIIDEKTATLNRRMAQEENLKLLNSLYPEKEGIQEQDQVSSAQSTKVPTEPEAPTVRFEDLEYAFQRVVAHFISGEAVGKLDGLEPRIEVAAGSTLREKREEIGGDRGALLGVLAFDFAVLVLSMEKEISVPPLLVHDSPRSQDIDEASYSRLFLLARALEEACGKLPLFQYIVTTSTPPPPDLDCGEWCRLRLDRSEPDGKGRLFKKIF